MPLQRTESHFPLQLGFIPLFLQMCSLERNNYLKTCLLCQALVRAKHRLRSTRCLQRACRTGAVLRTPSAPGTAQELTRFPRHRLGTGQEGGGAASPPAISNDDSRRAWSWPRSPASPWIQSHLHGWGRSESPPFFKQSLCTSLLCSRGGIGAGETGSRSTASSPGVTFYS